MKRILIIVNLRTVIVAALAVAATYLCRRYGIVAEFPLTLVATAVVFPIVFSINGAYKRREHVLAHYSSIKAHSRAIYFATRDWLDEPDDELLERSRMLLGDFFCATRELFGGTVPDLNDNEQAVYRSLSRLSTFIRDDLRGRGLQSGEVSRCNQYLSKIMHSFEELKHVYQYRTPRTLRTFSDVFVAALPVAYGPYFAAVAVDYSAGLWAVTPVLFTVVLVSLDNIQEHLENPFDQVGEDDVQIKAEKFVELLDAC